MDQEVTPHSSLPVSKSLNEQFLNWWTGRGTEYDWQPSAKVFARWTL